MVLRLRVVLIGSEFLWRRRLRNRVAALEHLELVGEAADASEAVEVFAELMPDAVLLSASANDIENAKLFAELQQEFPSVVWLCEPGDNAWQPKSSIEEQLVGCDEAAVADLLYVCDQW